MRNKWFDYSFLGVGLLVQVVTFVVANHLAPDSPLTVISLICGLLGVCSVCLTAQGNILTYVFGFAQVITYAWLCISQRFYGEIAINAYYFITMIYGVFAWRKRLQPTGEQSAVITPRRLSYPVLALIVVLTLLGSWLAGWGLATWTDDTQPYLDAYTTVPALVAQVLMILVYREHWFLWLAVDVFSVALWLRAGDYCMTAQYVFWCANCIYGLRRWRTLTTNP
ncbi:MAG: nicotinamide mononucleotide transporter [Paludibacteraceae bacterium]|nr:nicotinamide mononucleotide transporter [Paludibacteraceae bacterium]